MTSASSAIARTLLATPSAKAIVILQPSDSSVPASHI
jgi:hypothetical protein